MMFENQNTNSITNLIHGKSAKILSEIGFCDLDVEALNRLEKVDFIADRDKQMVHISTNKLESALSTFPQNMNLFDRSGINPAPYQERSCFMCTDGIALDIIEGVGPGGHFLSQKHTRSHMRDIRIPDLTYPRMASDGNQNGDIRKRARDKFDRILAEHEPTPLEEAAQEEINVILNCAEVELTH